jgi:outer membrane protein assembly factor BamA
MLRSLALIALLAGNLAQAQQQVLTVEADSTLPRSLRGPFKVTPGGAAARAAQLRGELIAEGYLAASVDSCTSGPDSTHCFLHLGKPYRWARLTAGGVPPEIASATGFRERFYRGRPIAPKQVAQLVEGLLKECEDHGHPFAEVRLDSLRETEDGLTASVHLDRGRRITFDSVLVRGTARVSPRYLQAYIGIKPGDAYNESLVRALDDRTRELPFVTAKHAAYVLFAPGTTKLYLFLDAKRASNFNGIVGLAQDPVTGKVRFTGDLDLQLRNALHHGEAINLNWRSLQDRTQDLRIGFNYPFAFNTPFGADLNLKLFKRDTTFLETTTGAALEYLLRHGDKLRILLNGKSSKRLGQQLTYVPGLADVGITAYGLGLFRERFDYRFNPRRGLGLDLQATVGRKKTSTATLSDTTSKEVRSIQYELQGKVVWHIPLGGRSTVRLVAQGASMLNDQLYTNELYRIGGIRTQRGVDEAGIYCSSYAIGTVEYRFLFEENSNFFLFLDQGWWEDQSRDKLLTDTPIGFGAGTSFETKAGIFSLSYALRRQFSNPVELRNGKVHFGFTSLF